MDLINKILIINNRNKNQISFYHFNWNILLIIFFIIIFPHIYLAENSLYILTKLNLKNEISITIKGSGLQNILSNNYNGTLPDTILVNGNEETPKKIVNLVKNENNITMIWNAQIKSCDGMFAFCNNIKTINFIDFDTSLVTSMRIMFINCTSLISLDLSGINTSSVEDMYAMFYGCNSLKSIDLSSFNTNRVRNMYSMFYGCSSLTSLDVSSFNTSLITTMEGMFHDCSSLITLNLSNFNTTSVKSMRVTFHNCASLISLDLSNFNTNLVTDMEAMFGKCSSLIYLNILSFKKNENNFMDYIFYEINPSLISCSNSDFSEPNINNDCENICFKKPSKVILKEKKCTNDCSSAIGNQYEYNNICYEKCPDNTHKSLKNEYLCEKDLNCELLNKYYSYDKSTCIDEIPLGYFNNDTIYNTIDKCHQDCKTCDKIYNEYSSNCNSCLNDKFLFLGNCTSDCPYGYYTDLLGNKNCKCSSKCKECSIESLELDLCISCNTDYFQKIDDIPSDKSFIQCYKEPEGYYLDNDIYKPCYLYCNKCLGFGDENSNNCIECKSGYIFESEGNCYEICPFYYYFDSSNKYHCTDDYICPIEQNKLIKEKNKCINNCKNDGIYQYEYNNTCYISCPERTIKSKNNKFLCEKTTDCPEDKPYETKNNECIKDCNATDFFNGKCTINNNNITIHDDMIKNIKNHLNESIDLLLNSTNNEHREFLVKAKEVSYQLTTSDNQNNKEYTDISKIKLGECENILKGIYGIDLNKSLVIFKIDYSLPGLSIPIIGYEIYHPDTKIKLNLTYCKESIIDFDIPVSIDENNLFKYDPNNEYYIDECYPYTTDNGTDIILDDRKEEFIDNNLSLCENGCEYKGYDEITKKVSCACGVKIEEFVITDIIKDNNLLSNNFTFDNTTSNFVTMKCIYTLFTKEGLIKNIANYILMATFFLFIILTILFFKIGYYLLETDINQIVSSKKTKEKVNNIISPCDKMLKKKKIKKKQKILEPPKKIYKKKAKDEKVLNSFEHKCDNTPKSSSLINMKNSTFVAVFEKEKIKKYKVTPQFYECELNLFSFKEALKYDKRTFIQYYISLIKTKHPIYFSFIPIKDYNTIIVKVSLFLLSFIIYFTINNFFFTKSCIHEIYSNQGVYNIGNYKTQIILSFIISHIIYSIIKYFSLSEKDLLKIKYEMKLDELTDKIDNVKKCLIIKYSLFYTFGFAFFIFCWYYLSSFCAVFKNSQKYLIINTIISFSISFIYPFLINIIPSLFRIIALKRNNNCLFNISLILQYI